MMCRHRRHGVVLMKSIRKILVAVKNTRQKRCPAVIKAATLAHALGAQLELFHVISGPVAFEAFAPGTMEKMQEEARALQLARLEKIAAPLRHRGIKVSTAVEWDFPAHEALIRRARRVRAHLVVAGRHESRHVAPWLLRYADWELVRQSPVPVLLVKNARPYRAPRLLAAVDPSHAFAKTAQLDKAILQLGAQVGTALRGQLHVLHAYMPTVLGMDEADLTAVNASQRIADQAAAGARTRLEKSLRSAGVASLAAARRHLIPLHPVASIPRLARRIGCDIDVIGAISRSGLKGLLIGNTAERLLDDLPCDLLVVKPRGFATRVPARVRGPELYFAPPPSGML